MQNQSLRKWFEWGFKLILLKRILLVAKWGSNMSPKNHLKQRASEFAAAAVNENRLKRPAYDDLNIKINDLPLSRDPFEDGR